MKRTTDPMQGELFTVTDAPVKVPPRPKPSTSSRPKWSKYHTATGVKCDDCMLVLALAKGNAPASRQARWRRRHGDSDLLLCYAHASERRVDDGMEPLSGKG